MTPLQLSGWGTLTVLGGTASGFHRLCAGEGGLASAAGPPWLDAAAGLALLGPLGFVPGTAAGLLAELTAGLDLDPVGLAVVLATTGGASPDGEVTVGAYVRGEPLSAPRALWWDNLPHHLVEAVGRGRGVTGPCLVVSTACTSGTVAVGVAADLVRAGVARRVLVLGVDVLCRSSLFGFRSLGVASRDACRPFDTFRSGMCVGSGAAYVVVEPSGPGARFELLGVGVAQDAAHLTAPDPRGAGLGRAIVAALAGVDPRAVDHVNAHGTATLANDATEALVLPDLLPNAAVSATKGATGHTLGAAGLIELVFLLQSMEAGVVPPVVGLREAIAGVDVSARLRERAQSVGVSVNLAFGGHNAAVAVRRGPGPTPIRRAGVEAAPLSAVVLGATSWTVAGRDTDPTQLPPRFAEGLALCHAPDPVRPAHVPAGDWRRMSRLARLTVSTASPLVPADPADLPVIFALSGGEYTSGIHFLRSYFKDPALSSPLAFQGTVHNAPAAHLSIAMGLGGPSETLLAGLDSLWRGVQCALARVRVTGRPVLLVVGEELTLEVGDGLRAAGHVGVWGEAVGALLLGPVGPGPRITWRSGPAPADAWGPGQLLPDRGGGGPGFAWDRAFGLGAGSEAAALVALTRGRGGALAGPGAWLEVG